MWVSEVGKQIKEHWVTFGIMQPDLAEMSEISMNILYKIETGQANLTLNVLNKTFNILDMELTLTVKKPEL